MFINTLLCILKWSLNILNMRISQSQNGMSMLKNYPVYFVIHNHPIVYYGIGTYNSANVYIYMRTHAEEMQFSLRPTVIYNL